MVTFSIYLNRRVFVMFVRYLHNQSTVSVMCDCLHRSTTLVYSIYKRDNNRLFPLLTLSYLMIRFNKNQRTYLNKHFLEKALCTWPVLKKKRAFVTSDEYKK